MCACACQDMSTLVSLVVRLWPWARVREQACMCAPARRTLETPLALPRRAGRQHGGSGPSSLWLRRCLGLAGGGQVGPCLMTPEGELCEARTRVFAELGTDREAEAVAPGDNACSRVLFQECS